MAVSSLSASVRINEFDINEISKPGKVISFKPKNGNICAFSFSNNHLKIGSFNKKKLHKEHEIFNLLLNFKIYSLGLSNSGSELLNLCSNQNDVCYSRAFLTGANIAMAAKKNLHITHSILEAKDTITLTTDHCILNNCYISKAEFLQIQSNSADSLIQMIKIKVSKEKPFCLITGDITFSLDATSRAFTIYGATEIFILLHPKAYE